ncbi:NAD-dependent epimerase/dehydratase family protein [Streptomyces sp. NPDC006173]|uniref:NAD-dependent epimerase/dehydratase family protein n=1 Tax=Streptomyces sp. NPDC006173 TaxID=3155349 RepID=UPI0033DF4E06
MRATDALRVDGTAHLVEAARATGARRIIAESMVFGYGYGDHGDHVLTEDDPYGPPGTTPALEQHIAAMRIKEQLTFGATDMEGIALRFGLFYGAGGTDALLPMLPMLRRRQLPVADDHGRVLPWVDLADAARTVAAAVDRGRPGEAYNVIDRTPLGFAAHVRAAAEEFGLPRPMTIPLWTMRPLSYAHVMMRTALRATSAKAERELGWTPLHASSRDGLAALRAAV